MERSENKIFVILKKIWKFVIKVSNLLFISIFFVKIIYILDSLAKTINTYLLFKIVFFSLYLANFTQTRKERLASLYALYSFGKIKHKKCIKCCIKVKILILKYLNINKIPGEKTYSQYVYKKFLHFINIHLKCLFSRDNFTKVFKQTSLWGCIHKKIIQNKYEYIS